jgi:hypothetical protein
MQRAKFVFIGSTSFGGNPHRDPLRACGFELCPPAERGHVHHVIEDQPPGMLVLVDGSGRGTLPVGHAELRRAIELGWAVWGLGSLGAIRAYEMRALGMRGFGRVYEHLLAHDDVGDDELLWHGWHDGGLTCESEPLIHLRSFAVALSSLGWLDVPTTGRVLETLKNRWYGDRSFALAISVIREYAGEEAAGAAEALLVDPEPFRIIRSDVAEFARLAFEGNWGQEPGLRDGAPRDCADALV